MQFKAEYIYSIMMLYIYITQVKHVLKNFDAEPVRIQNYKI